MEKPSHTKPSSHHTKPPPSKAQLLSSAKVVAGAAKATLSHDSQKVDKARVAGATADILGAASHYGKLQEKSLGKYVGKAEAYLHQYHSSQSSHSSTTTSSSSGGGGHSAHSSSSSSSHSGGGGYGDYLKLAQGLLKKH
ncbi:hypothetical protein QJS04_geneDACA006889 [Acorus gramineus]|uniref:Uncharacterized protein n=1 Tax=Acorus gramineus TaxID=55184 RepID=A0AAV9B1T6_ACOGR|nr:hypothetical protein QJS04_geneDACA006889 [Acorus gramineus]